MRALIILLRLPSLLVVFPVILFYRRFLSSRKGYKCAHAYVSKGPSCSDVGLSAFLTLPIHKAIAEMQEQKSRCAHSYKLHMENMEIESGLVGAGGVATGEPLVCECFDTVL